ncbi:hypothetical protein H5410_055824 [Solanum commersonii]|uniref:Uncharacterized protein n=1 Tax=Solanum commersonii TaxID=4109 RepID=A0A9J5WJG8_SOLCO|nr:hypothetical protein H5410_055824 [Solanum commersonii]
MSCQDQRSLYSIKSDDLVEDLPQDSEDQYRNTGLQVVSTLSCDEDGYFVVRMKVSLYIIYSLLKLFSTFRTMAYKSNLEYFHGQFERIDIKSFCLDIFS